MPSQSKPPGKHLCTPEFSCQNACSPIDIRYEVGATFLQNFDRNPRMSSSQTNLLQGTLDLLILKALKTGELHGLGVSRRIDQMTRGTFQVKPGSLFPALHRG